MVYQDKLFSICKCRVKTNWINPNIQGVKLFNDEEGCVQNENEREPGMFDSRRTEEKKEGYGCARRDSALETGDSRAFCAISLHGAQSEPSRTEPNSTEQCRTPVLRLGDDESATRGDKFEGVPLHSETRHRKEHFAESKAWMARRQGEGERITRRTLLGRT